jgi:uncharacterized protein
VLNCLIVNSNLAIDNFTMEKDYDMNTTKIISENKNAVEKYMNAFEKGHSLKVLSCLTDDVVWILLGVFHLKGKKEFEGEIRNDAFQGDPEIKVTRMTEENDVVIAEGSVRIQKKNGEFVNLAFCDVFEMQNEKIKKLTSYLMEVKETN